MKGRLIVSSPWSKLFFVFALVISSAMMSLFIGAFALPLFFDYSMSEFFEIASNPELMERTDIVLYMQGVSTIGTFLVPAMIGAYLISPYPSSFLGLDNFPKRVSLIIILLLVLTLSGTVISDTLFKLTNAIPFSESWSSIMQYFQETQNVMETQMASFLDMQGPMDFIVVLMVMAILPAVCEESLFRGVLQPLFIRGFKSTWGGILFSSLIFGILHQQFFSFLSIFTLSVILGYLKFWTKSLWVPIIMHFFNNASIVVAIYFFNVSLEDVSAGSSSWDFSLIFGGLATFSLCLYAIHRFFKIRNKELV